MSAKDIDRRHPLVQKGKGGSQGIRRNSEGGPPGAEMRAEAPTGPRQRPPPKLVFQETALEGGCGIKFLKWLMLILNFMTLIGAIAALILCIIHTVNIVNLLVPNKHYCPIYAWYAIIGLCCIIILMSILGTAASFMENRTALFVYAILLTFMALLLIGAVAVGLVFRGFVETQVDNMAREWLQDVYQETNDPIGQGTEFVYEKWLQHEKCCHFTKRINTTLAAVIHFWHHKTRWGTKRKLFLDKYPGKAVNLVPSDMCCEQERQCPKVTRDEWRLAEVFGRHEPIFTKRCNGILGSLTPLQYIILAFSALAVLLLMGWFIVMAACLYRRIVTVDYFLKEENNRASGGATPMSLFYSKGDTSSDTDGELFTEEPPQRKRPRSIF